ncbi:SMP-30/gluconolactonase/LRE family protein [Oceaniferula marina]|nr:SMP-30/gluconolactonase/LRE family protein [Oceaniferula marina]
MATIDPIGSYVAQWGEGPLWWQDRLMYVDIERGRVLQLDPLTGEEKMWDVSDRVGRVGTVVPRSDGGWLVAGDSGLHFFDPASGETKAIVDPESDKADNRFNDGKCSPDGRFFAGTISLVKSEGDAALYRLDPDGSCQVAFEGVTNSNGIVWSADASTCYYIDTPRREILAFDYCSESGQLSSMRVLLSTAAVDASPDGMTIDSEGRLWVAFCHGACVVCYDPKTGKAVHRVDFPCLETTACAFGGSNLDELYVTTGIHATVREEHAGRVFCVRGLGVTGVTAHAFGAYTTPQNRRDD